MKLLLGSDEAGFELKERLKEFLKTKADLEDVGVYQMEPVLYPDVAATVAERIRRGEADRGILICGTGIGMAMTANKIPGVRAAVCHDCFSAERSVKSNDAQIMCLGARVIGPELAKVLAGVWLDCRFEDGPSTQKIQKMRYYEERARR